MHLNCIMQYVLFYGKLTYITLLWRLGMHGMGWIGCFFIYFTGVKQCQYGPFSCTTSSCLPLFVFWWCLFLCRLEINRRHIYVHSFVCLPNVQCHPALYSQPILWFCVVILSVFALRYVACMYVCILHLLRTNMSLKWKNFICANRRYGMAYTSCRICKDTSIHYKSLLLLLLLLLLVVWSSLKEFLQVTILFCNEWLDEVLFT